MTKEEYAEYRQGIWWRNLSRAIRKSMGKCQHCGFRYELNVHHKNYERLGHEQREDLIVLCKACHSREHFLDNFDSMPLYLAITSDSKDQIQKRLEAQRQEAKKKNIERDDEIRENKRKQKEQDY